MHMKPLNGLRILEFDGLGPVTFAGMMLADMGAEVLRLTRSDAAGPAVFSEVGGAVLHRNRAAVPVDLKSASDRRGVLSLVESADAVIEGFRPRFNALNLFRVPQSHLVSYVPPFAPIGRMAVTGWLRSL